MAVVCVRVRVCVECITLQIICDELYLEIFVVLSQGFLSVGSSLMQVRFSREHTRSYIWTAVRLSK